MASAGLRVGLLGGSFDPPHAGHVHITRQALRRFGLDFVWWLVSPGNPLKDKGPAEMAKRIAACQDLLRHPRVIVTNLEAQLGTQHTAKTVAQLQALYPKVHFTWLMGADNLAQFHHWDNWRDIIERLPIGVLARPGEQLSAGMSKAATVYGRYRLNARQARALPLHSAPCWTLINGPMVDISSSDIRNRGDWGA